LSEKRIGKSSHKNVAEGVKMSFSNELPLQFVL